MKGKCVHWNDERGFGFIKTDNKTKVFFHRTKLLNEDYVPEQGDLLDFEIKTMEDGRFQAYRIKKAQPEPEPQEPPGFLDKKEDK